MLDSSSSSVPIPARLHVRLSTQDQNSKFNISSLRGIIQSGLKCPLLSLHCVSSRNGVHRCGIAERFSLSAESVYVPRWTVVKFGRRRRRRASRLYAVRVARTRRNRTREMRDALLMAVISNALRRLLSRFMPSLHMPVHGWKTYDNHLPFQSTILTCTTYTSTPLPYIPFKALLR